MSDMTDEWRPEYHRPMTDTPDNADTTPEAAEGTVIPPDDQPGEWLSPPAAALRLGVAERTMWRHVKDGRYHKRTVAGRAEILVPGERDSAPDSSASGSVPAVRQMPDTLALAVIDELRAQREADSQRLSEQADRIATLAAEKAKAESDATHALEAAQIERERRLEAEAEVARLRRPWWRRILDG